MNLFRNGLNGLEGVHRSNFQLAGPGARRGEVSVSHPIAPAAVDPYSVGFAHGRIRREEQQESLGLGSSANQFCLEWPLLDGAMARLTGRVCSGTPGPAVFGSGLTGGRPAGWNGLAAPNPWANRPLRTDSWIESPSEAGEGESLSGLPAPQQRELAKEIGRLIDLSAHQLDQLQEWVKELGHLVGLSAHQLEQQRELITEESRLSRRLTQQLQQLQELWALELPPSAFACPPSGSQSARVSACRSDWRVGGESRRGSLSRFRLGSKGGLARASGAAGVEGPPALATVLGGPGSKAPSAARSSVSGGLRTLLTSNFDVGELSSSGSFGPATPPLPSAPLAGHPMASNPAGSSSRLVRPIGPLGIGDFFPSSPLSPSKAFPGAGAPELPIGSARAGVARPNATADSRPSALVHCSNGPTRPEALDSARRHESHVRWLAGSSAEFSTRGQLPVAPSPVAAEGLPSSQGRSAYGRGASSIPYVPVTRPPLSSSSSSSLSLVHSGGEIQKPEVAEAGAGNSPSPSLTETKKKEDQPAQSPSGLTPSNGLAASGPLHGHDPLVQWAEEALSATPGRAEPIRSGSASASLVRADSPSLSVVPRPVASQVRSRDYPKAGARLAKKGVV